MTKVVIDDGICGCTITVEVIKLGRRKVRITIAGDCDMVNQKHIIVFQPSGYGGYIDEGKTIKEASRELGVDLEGICGGRAACGKCTVRIGEGFSAVASTRSQPRPSDFCLIAL